MLSFQSVPPRLAGRALAHAQPFFERHPLLVVEVPERADGSPHTALPGEAGRQLLQRQINLVRNQSQQIRRVWVEFGPHGMALLVCGPAIRWRGLSSGVRRHRPRQKPRPYCGRPEKRLPGPWPPSSPAGRFWTSSWAHSRAG